MKQILTFQGHPISIELIEPCCAPTPDKNFFDPDCKAIIEKLEWLEQYLLHNPELSWQLVGFRVSEVFQRDFDRWDIVLSNGSKQVKCWIKTGAKQNDTSLYWAAVQQAW